MKTIENRSSYRRHRIGNTTVFAGLLFGFGMASVAFLTTSVLAYDYEDYDWAGLTIDCESRTLSFGTLTVADYPQDPLNQLVAWAIFMSVYTGLVNDDYVDKQTAKYNCHSYIFHDSDKC